jgi:hypothetical protein
LFVHILHKNCSKHLGIIHRIGMVLSKAKKRSAFQPGSLVVVKKSNLKGKIVDTIGSKKWKVQLTLDGRTTHADYTSQQLRHPKDHELPDESSNSSNSSNVQVPTTSDEQTGVEPALVSDASARVATRLNALQVPTTSDEQTGAEPVLVRDPAQPRRVQFAATRSDEQTGVHPAPASDPQAQPPRARAISTRQPRVAAEEAMPVLHEDSDSDEENLSFMDIPCDEDDDESANLQDSGDDDILPPRPQCQLDHDLLSDTNSDDDESPASESNNEEEDPDEDLSEDLPSRNRDADGTEEDISGATFAAQLEPEDDRFRRKQEFYKLDKQTLIDDKWTVKKKPSKQNKLAIGATVQERSGAKRSGLIVGNGGEARTWMVQFEGSDENEEQSSSSRLKLVQDNSEYVWTIVKDSSPEQNKAVTEYRDIGLMGIHFRKSFSNTSPSNEDYDYPYLNLLQTLWPGKF